MGGGGHCRQSFQGCHQWYTYQYQIPLSDLVPNHCLLCHLKQSLCHQQELRNEDTSEHHWNAESTIFSYPSDNKKFHQMFWSKYCCAFCIHRGWRYVLCLGEVHCYVHTLALCCLVQSHLFSTTYPLKKKDGKKLLINVIKLKSVGTRYIIYTLKKCNLRPSRFYYFGKHYSLCQSLGSFWSFYHSKSSGRCNLKTVTPVWHTKNL